MLDFDAASAARTLECMAAKGPIGRIAKADPDFDWEGRYLATKAYADLHGHCRVGPQTRWNGKNIGHWVRNHRAWYRIPNRLSQETIKRIEEIPHWVWSPGSNWNDKFDLFEQAMAALGEPAMHAKTSFRGFKVGVWVRMQRERYELKTLQEDRIGLLESVPGWRWQARPVKPKS